MCSIKAITLIALPLAIFIPISLIFNNALAWQTTYGTDLTHDVAFSIIPSDSVILLLLTGRLDVLWQMLQTPSVNWSVISVLASFVGGAFLFLLSLGLSISVTGEAATFGAGGSIGINPQGSKVGQMIGIGMLIWAVVSGTLGTWTSYFDAIASGMGTVFTLLLEFVFILGLCWQSQSAL